MSESTATGPPALSFAEQIAECEAAAERLRDAYRRSRRSHRLLLLIPIAVLLGVAATGASIWHHVRTPEYRAELAAEARAEFKRQSAFSNRFADRFIAEATPVLTEALKQRIREDAETYLAALNAQGGPFAANLGRQLEERVNARYARELDSYEEILRSEFPALQNDALLDRLRAAMDASLQQLVRETYADPFQEELTGMADAWNEFPVEVDPEAAVADELFDSIRDLLATKLRGETSDTQPEETERRGGRSKAEDS